jgi:hypothetical protein
VVEKGLHTTLVKAMCLCASTNQIITLAEGTKLRGRGRAERGKRREQERVDNERRKII